MAEAIRKLEERKRAGQLDPRATTGAEPGVDWSRAESSPDTPQRAMSPREMAGESPSNQTNMNPVGRQDAKRRLAQAIVNAHKQAGHLESIQRAHTQDAAALSALLDALPTTLSTPAEFGLNRLLDRAGY